MRTKFLILGAGPAGLSFANRLFQLGETNFLIIEKEKNAGGLCRSLNIDGSPLDIGGGHFLDVRRPHVNNFLFQFMPESEWNLFDRDSRIQLDRIEISHPFESNIWQMPQDMQVSYLKSIAIAGCNLGLVPPRKFTDWIRWKLGDLIADNYMIPYNSKLFGNHLDELGTYWLDKLPNVSFDETLMSCLERKPYGTEPGHSKFYYPQKYGYGELWNRMASAISEHIIYEGHVSVINFNEKKIKTADGLEVSADIIINTIPWTSIEVLQDMEEDLRIKVKELKHTSLNITYIPQNLNTTAQWIYYPDIKLSYHRVLVRSNFVLNAKGYWTETNSDRYIDENNISFKNQYAYPLNTLEKPFIIKELLKWAKSKNVIGLGRWGEWEHYNSDTTVEKAIQLCEKIIKEI